ncbi:hypothetical protein [Kluyvera ascorbata]|jgi:hypothetical protein|nr:hypothetical protein [Kluyvera ascorbata]BBV66315.1 hypothetical protein STW0522KLE44_27030 [Klebsiella sp. STW0522-44]HEB4875113.1 hypothetical protein [Kluyvera ascorbata F0526]EJG2386577.1 hypothetical protein [Kluyvera ascorbata]MDT8701268.1 hypothetical protein [Kluyvera ascorbata]MDU3911824.1 hypothetical protein [Kluyvera ascorbata]
MNKVSNPVMYLTAIIAIASLLLSAYLLFTRQPRGSMNVDCSTMLQMAYKDPDLTATIDLTFRLHRNHTGQVALSGKIKQDDRTQTISRTMLFDYEVKTPGEISLDNMRYAKNLKDSVTDDEFKMNFFYVPDGQKRTIKIRATRNAYLIENLHSPVFLCVNTKL